MAPANVDNDFELDLNGLMRRLVSRWWILGLSVALGIGVAVVYNYTSPRLYRASMTFFLPSAQPSGPNALQTYASILGTGLPSNLEDRMVSIGHSQRVRQCIVRDIRGQFPKLAAVGPSDVGAYSDLPQLDLQSRLTIEKDKSGLFLLAFEHPDAAVAGAVVGAYYRSLIEVYEQLDISPERDILKVLDDVMVSPEPVKPQLNFNLGVGAISGFGVGFFLALLSLEAGKSRDD